MGREELGGKGMFLANMEELGLSVPPFRSITLSTLNHFQAQPIPIGLVKQRIPEIADSGSGVITLSEIEGQIRALYFFDEKTKEKWLTGFQALITSDDFYNSIIGSPAFENIQSLKKMEHFTEDMDDFLKGYEEFLHLGEKRRRKPFNHAEMKLNRYEKN